MPFETSTLGPGNSHRCSRVVAETLDMQSIYRSIRIVAIACLATLPIVLLGCGSYGANGKGGGTAPPAPPTGLMATAGNAQVSLSWSVSTGATLYYVKRATTSGGPYTQISSPAATTYTDTGLTNGTEFFYVVSAYNSAGPSANSAEVNATPTAPPVPPPAPANLQATAGNAQVSLTWNASAGATSYHVRRSTTNGSGYMQIAAPTVANYVDTGRTNGTTYYYVVTALNSAGESAISAQASATPANVAADVTIIVDPTQTQSISPSIYGINFYNGVSGAPPLLTFDRAGGNRWTAYNWETNASNAGSDFLYQNDSYLSSSNVPAEAVRGFIAADQAKGVASLVTFQLQGLVSADENGPVSVTNPPDLTRFKTVVDKKGSAFTASPSTADASVYMDDYITKTINLSKALKDQFPNALIFGPVHYGFQGIYNWQGELAATPSGTNWFPDKYFQALKTASTSYGRPLVDVYDFHWYAEVYDAGGTRILNLTSTSLTDAQVQLIVQSPRGLWDPTFNDDNNSSPWIFNELGRTPINILGRLQAKINAENPGMKIAITEYENGGWNHIAGAIAQADNLGIFGAQGVFAANFWPPNGTYSYALAGFRAFRGFDGATANFGDTSLPATSTSVKDVVVYASLDSTAPGRVVFVAINRSNATKVAAINGQSLSGTAHIYQMTAASAQAQNPVHPVAAGQMPVSGSSLTITLPALSVTTIDIY